MSDWDTTRAETTTEAEPARATIELTHFTDEEPWVPPIRDEIVAQRWEIDWWRALGCLLIVVTGVGFWALVAWTVARVLRGG